MGYNSQLHTIMVLNQQGYVTGILTQLPSCLAFTICHAKSQKPKWNVQKNKFPPENQRPFQEPVRLEV